MLHAMWRSSRNHFYSLWFDQSGAGTHNRFSMLTYAVPGLLMEVNWFMVLNATFNNISVISWWSVLLVEETGVPGENHRLVASH
jgi:ABC-type Fe3+ transport system permease subunit